MNCKQGQQTMRDTTLRKRLKLIKPRINEMMILVVSGVDLHFLLSIHPSTSSNQGLKRLMI